MRLQQNQRTHVAADVLSNSTNEKLFIGFFQCLARCIRSGQTTFVEN
jgi:undecaprenyl pyrophosphate phosphatase UppP